MLHCHLNVKQEFKFDSYQAVCLTCAEDPASITGGHTKVQNVVQCQLTEHSVFSASVLLCTSYSNASCPVELADTIPVATLCRLFSM